MVTFCNVKFNSITLPEGLERIENGTFNECFSLTGDNTNVTFIDEWAFRCVKN